MDVQCANKEDSGVGDNNSIATFLVFSYNKINLFFLFTPYGA